MILLGYNSKVSALNPRPRPIFADLGTNPCRLVSSPRFLFLRWTQNSRHTNCKRLLTQTFCRYFSRATTFRFFFTHNSFWTPFFCPTNTLPSPSTYSQYHNMLPSRGNTGKVLAKRKLFIGWQLAIRKSGYFIDVVAKFNCFCFELSNYNSLV